MLICMFITVRHLYSSSARRIDYINVSFYFFKINFKIILTSPPRSTRVSSFHF
jgi:hypothetical protein